MSKWRRAKDYKDWRLSPEVCEHAFRDHSRYYLGYGSNLNILQMQQRCPTAMPIMACELLEYKLVFSDVATVEKCEGSKVPACIWHVNASDIAALDIYEGYPNLYDKRTATITIDGKVQQCFFYVLDCEYQESAPSAGYYRTCLEGYREWGLDEACLRNAEASAENVERDCDNNPQACAFCTEVGTEGYMWHTRNYGWLCDDCHDIMFFSKGADRPYTGARYAEKYDRNEENYRYADQYHIMPQEVWGKQFYDDMTGSYSSHDGCREDEALFNPAELDWGGGKYVDDTWFDEFSQTA